MAPLRNECWEFFRGNSYVYRNEDGSLVQQATTLSVRGRGKPPHRVRTERPLLVPLIRQEVSYATSRTPSYDVGPTNTDPETVAAAKVAEKVALYGYDKWSIQRVTEDCVTHALVADEAFAWPYWDDKYGKPIGEDPETGDTLYEGEVCVRVYGSGQVGWEPGVRFEDSRWYIIVQAEPVDQVLARPNVLVTDIDPDATDAMVVGKERTKHSKLALITEYLERPSVKYPAGRRLVMAKGKQISPEEPYPFEGPDGVVDEPVLHKLTVIRDPDSDRDLGLVRFGLDCIRSHNDAVNKSLEWKNLALNPQVLAQFGAVPPGTTFTDEPGAVFEVARVDQVKWRDVPAVPRELFEMADRAKADLGFIFSQNDIPGQVEAARAIQSLLERDSNARASFLRNLADFHSRVMRHCLMLVQTHYSEKRDLQIVGDFGPEILYGFLGASLLDQVSVRVLPGSLEPQTKEAITNKVMSFAQLGWISPQAAMAAIDGGTAEALVKDYELDVGRAHLVIEKIKQGPESLFGTPDNPDGTPGWMPRPFDSIPVHKQVFESFMKTVAYDNLDVGQKEATNLYYQGLQQLEAEQQARAIEAQNAMAEQQGMNNAARQQGAKPPPDQPKMDGPLPSQ